MGTDRRAVRRARRGRADAGRRAEPRGRASGWPTAPQAGLELVDALTGEPALRAYPYLPSIRGDLLTKMGRYDEARIEFERAAELSQNVPERDLLTARAKAVLDLLAARP